MTANFVRLLIVIASTAMPLQTHAKKHKSHATNTVVAASVSDSDEIATKLINDIENRPLREQFRETRAVNAGADKTSWLSEIYRINLVEASKLNALLSDKLLQNKVFEHYAKSERFLLHTVGLKEFLLKYNLVDKEQNLLPDADHFEEALATEFPNGFIVRPALGVAPSERNHGLFSSSDDFLKEIFKPHNNLYQPSTLHLRIKSHIIGAVASGEAIVLQEDFARSADKKYYERYRVHSFENKVVKDAIPDLWMIKRNFEADKTKIEVFAQEFLDTLPEKLCTREAWGIDIGVLDSGQMKILDIVTNRGLKISWSSYLDEPKILGAYTRHLQQYLNIDFGGMNGILLRNNLANYFPYWKLRRERTGQNTSFMQSSLPPWPF